MRPKIELNYAVAPDVAEAMGEAAGALVEAIEGGARRESRRPGDGVSIIAATLNALEIDVTSTIYGSPVSAKLRGGR